MLNIYLFGTPQIFRSGEEIRLKRRKSRALLYYLAASSRTITREHLLSLFWTDTERTAAQQTLRTSLHGLRKELGEALLIEDDRLALSPEVEVDAVRFVQLLTARSPNREDLIAAISYYRGDLLADFSLPDAPAFENWLSIERERLRRMAVRAWVSLSRSYESEGDYQAAADRIEEALALDALQEDLQRELIRLLYLAGDRPSAVQRYDQLRRLLDEELGVPPMLETRRLYDSILNDTLSPAVQNPAQKSVSWEAPQKKEAYRSEPREGPPLPQAASIGSSARKNDGQILPFVGRAAEMEMLQRLAERLPPVSPPRLTLIEGEPGIGKSRLAAEFIEVSGLLAGRGAAHELEQNIPYQPVIEALRDLIHSPQWPEIQAHLQIQPIWLEETRRLLPELAPQPAANTALTPVNEGRLWEGIHQFAAAVARVRPLVLLLDDLHWADPSTLGLLGYLVRQAEQPILFLATARSDQPRGALAGLSSALMRAGRLTSIRLERFSQTDLVALAGELSPEFAYPLANWLQINSEGIPFVLAELVRYGIENFIISSDGQLNLSALSSAPVVPQTVYSLTQSRLDQLSGPARRVLDTAVASGRQFDFEVVYRAAGLSEAAALDALDELHQAGLIRQLEEPDAASEEITKYSFTHSIILEVASREMGEARRRLLHRRLAESLEKVHMNRLEIFEGQIAYHYLEGGDSASAAPYALRAGERAAALAAWKEAVDFYEQALRGTHDPSTRRQVLLKLAGARFQAGEGPRASEDYRTAAALAPQGSDEQVEILLDLSESLLTQARFSEVVSLIQQVYPGPRQDLNMRALFLWGTALSLEGADLAGAAERLRQAEALCRTCSGPLPLADIKFELGSVLAQLGDLPGAVVLYRESLEAAELAGEEGLARLVLAYNNLAYHLLLMDDPAAKGYAEKGLALSIEKGLLFVQPYLYSTLGEIALAERNLEEAELYFSRGLTAAEMHNVPERVAGLTANLGLLAQQRGQDVLAIHRLSTALARAETLGTQHLAAQIRIWLAPLLPLTEALEHLAEARAVAENSKRKRLLDEVLRLEQTLK